MNVLALTLETKFVARGLSWDMALTNIILLNQNERAKTQVEMWRMPSAVELQLMVREGGFDLPFGFYWSADAVPFELDYAKTVEVNVERDVKDPVCVNRSHPAAKHCLVAVRFV